MSSDSRRSLPRSQSPHAQKGSTNANGFTDYFDLDGLLTEEHLLVRQSIRDFVKKEISAQHREVGAGRAFPERNRAQVWRRGRLRPHHPARSTAAAASTTSATA